jgi:hypothetical protein
MILVLNAARFSSSTIGFKTVSQLAFSGLTSAAILSSILLECSQIDFASSTKLDGVAMKAGGACGGFAYFAAAIVEVVMGRYEVVVVVRFVGM